MLIKFLTYKINIFFQQYFCWAVKDKVPLRYLYFLFYIENFLQWLEIFGIKLAVSVVTEKWSFYPSISTAKLLSLDTEQLLIEDEKSSGWAKSLEIRFIYKFNFDSKLAKLRSFCVFSYCLFASSAGWDWLINRPFLKWNIHPQKSNLVLISR